MTTLLIIIITVMLFGVVVFGLKVILPVLKDIKDIKNVKHVSRKL